MTDPTGHDPLLRWLAYGHPVWMLGSLGLAALALRAGLALRRARRAGRRDPVARRRHLRLAKPAVVLVLVGFLFGPLSMFALRGRVPFGTAHALVGSATAALFLAAGLLGRRLERGRSRAFNVHALLGVLAVLLGAVAFATGFVLLP